MPLNKNDKIFRRLDATNEVDYFTTISNVRDTGDGGASTNTNLINGHINSTAGFNQTFGEGAPIPQANL